MSSTGGRRTIKTAVSKRKVSAIERGLNQNDNSARVSEMLNSAKSVLFTAFPAPWVEVWNDRI